MLTRLLTSVSFTPDLLASDVTGADIYRDVDGKHSLSFQPSPIFNNLVLANEINRAPAKVQSALLEAVAENSVTPAGKIRQLPDFIMALVTRIRWHNKGHTLYRKHKWIASC